MVQTESALHDRRQLGAVQVKWQVLPLLQLQVDAPHSAVHVLDSSQLASQGGAAQVKLQVAPPAQVHCAPQSPLVDVVLVVELVVVVVPPVAPEPPVLAP